MPPFFQGLWLTIFLSLAALLALAQAIILGLCAFWSMSPDR